MYHHGLNPSIASRPRAAPPLEEQHRLLLAAQEIRTRRAGQHQQGDGREKADFYDGENKGGKLNSPPKAQQGDKRHGDFLCCGLLGLLVLVKEIASQDNARCLK